MANDDQQSAVARSIASSHEDLHVVTSISSCADLNSQSVVPSTVSQGMDLCLEFRSITKVHFHQKKKNSSNNFRLLGCRLFHPPILYMDRSITTFGSILAFITKFSIANFSFITRRSEPILHSSRSSGYFSKFSNFFSSVTIFDYFTKFSLEGVETCYVLNQFIRFTSLEIYGIFSSIPIQHFSDVTTPFVHPSRRTQPTQKCVRHHRHDLTSAQIRTPADLVSRRIFQAYSWIGRRCGTQSFLLESYCLPQLIRLFFTCCI